MSEQNVAVVRGIFEAGAGLTAGFDPSQKEEFLAALPGMIEQICDPEIEWIEAPERIDSTTRRGHEGVVESFRNWLDQWEEYSVEVGEIEDHGDCVLVAGKETGRGAGSGVGVDSPIWCVVRFRDGKIIRYEEFYDEDVARKAVGA
jgi:ketosteroid isomerase-like protein